MCFLLMKFYKPLLIFITLLVILAYLPIQAQPSILLDQNFKTQILTVGDNVKFYRDSQNTLNLEKALNLDWQKEAFELNDPVCVPKAKNEIIWLHFSLNVTHPKKYVLTTFNFYGTSELYYKHSSDHSWQKLIITEEDYYTNRPYFLYFFKQFVLELNKKGTYECYFKTRGFGAISMFSPQYLENYQIYANLILFFISIGALLAITFYNFFLVFATKDNIYIYYALYQLTNLIIGTFFSGILSAYGLDYTTASNGAGYTNFFFMSHLANQVFAYHFLKVPLTLGKIWTRIYWGLMVITVIVIIIAHFVPLHYMQMWAENLSVITPLCLWVSGLWAYFKKKRKEARFYVIAYVFYLVGFIITFLTAIGIYQDTAFGYNAFLLGAVFEAIFFSLALGDRISILKKEKERAQAENLQLVKEQKSILEQKVKERTIALERANQDIVAQNQELQTKREEILVQNEELKQTQEEISTQRDALAQANNALQRSQLRIELSIRTAQSIQKALLVSESKLSHHFKDHFIINHPKDVVSGDFFWLNEMDQKIVLVVADCTGHGVPGAFMTLIGNNLLNNIIQIDQIINPADILNRLHQEVKLVLNQEETLNNNGMDAVVVTLEKQEHQTQLTFSGAKNNLLIYTQAHLSELKGIRKSIGGIQNEEIQFNQQTLALHANDLIYLGSDGLEDQHNEKRKRFGRKRLKELINKIQGLPLTQQKQTIEDALATQMQGTDQRDDILLIGVKLG
ncbi:MAG TPA: hypothetical protein DCS93_26350 [Microscillaceae bacterium]|nr:hypothetical protein [Microscillaceae bacterium]